LQFYGHLDLSVDGASKGIKEGGAGQNPPATGKTGWQTDISSNLSYLGFRGDHDIGGGNRMVFQVETQIDVSATPGPSPVSQTSQGNVDNKVQGALASRNSFLGFAGGFGAFKVGKTDAPYKLSTSRMDPFSATVGDYNSIMGNTGGDNRAEFDTRLSHAMWYESPKMSGASFSALWAPGQNRASDNSINASGEPDCTGGGGGITKFLRRCLQRGRRLRGGWSVRDPGVRVSQVFQPRQRRSRECRGRRRIGGEGGRPVHVYA
jgi:predicted porin